MNRGVVEDKPFADAKTNQSVSSVHHPAGLSDPLLGAVLVPVVAVAASGGVAVSTPLKR